MVAKKTEKGTRRKAKKKKSAAAQKAKDKGKGLRKRNRLTKKIVPKKKAPKSKAKRQTKVVAPSARENLNKYKNPEDAIGRTEDTEAVEPETADEILDQVVDSVIDDLANADADPEPIEDEEHFEDEEGYF